MKRKFYFIFFILSFILILTSCKNNNYTATEYSYKLSDNITDIEINWRVGDIEITSGDEFSIIETSQDEKAIAPLNYSIIDNKLVLNYNNSNKTLKIVLDISRKYNSINIKSTTSYIKLLHITVEKINIYSKSCSFYSYNCKLTILNCNITSQKDWYATSINTCTINTFIFLAENMYKINVENNNCNYIFFKITRCNIINYTSNNTNFLNITQMYGNTHLELTSNKGYLLNIKAQLVSIDFETIHYNNTYVFYNGECVINCINNYGTISIKKLFKL